MLINDCKAEAVAWLVKCSPSVSEALRSVPTAIETGMVEFTCNPGTQDVEADEAVEMAQSVLPKDLGSTPSSHIAVPTVACNSSSRDSDAIL